MKPWEMLISEQISGLSLFYKKRRTCLKLFYANYQKITPNYCTSFINATPSLKPTLHAALISAAVSLTQSRILWNTSI
jgi:hypothetical protein